MRKPIAALALPLLLLAAEGCATSRPAVAQAPAAPPTASRCDVTQEKISAAADARAAPFGIAQHLAKNFPDHEVSWLMKDSVYQKFVVATNAKRFGRCNDAGCFQFAAPSARIRGAVQSSMKDGKHDPAALGAALGLSAKNLEGPLRMITFDFATAGACVRLPVEEDPGVWKCGSAEDKDCFQFGGYTSGGVPELVVIDAAASAARVEEVP